MVEYVTMYKVYVSSGKSPNAIWSNLAEKGMGLHSAYSASAAKFPEAIQTGLFVVTLYELFSMQLCALSWSVSITSILMSMFPRSAKEISRLISRYTVDLGHRYSSST